MDVIKKFKLNKTAFLASIMRRMPFLFKDDEFYLKLIFLFELHKWPDLKNPKTFNEKLQWLKINYRKPEFTMMVDKLAVKEYVSNIIGQDYIIPTLLVWDDVGEVDFEKLPNQFVLKTTHGGGSCGVVICNDKKVFDIVKAKKKLSKAMRMDLYNIWREWPYKNVPKKIFAEKFMKDDSSKELKDYKFFCFNGEPKLCQVISDRQIDERIDFFDMKWERINGLVGLTPGVKNSSCYIPRPKSFDTMKIIATKLSQNIPFVRVDLYEINGHCYFGEITFYPASGMGYFRPYFWNEKIGSWLILPNISMQ